MVDRRFILSLAFRITVGAVAAVGLVLLFVPGIARGLGRPSDVAPWALTRHDVPETVVHKYLLEDAGLRVSATRWQRNHERWAEMNEVERRDLLQQYGRLQKMSIEERQTLVERYKSLQDLPEAERKRLRRQAANLAAFEASLSRQDQAALDSLTGKHRASYLIKLWQASLGLE